MDGTLNIQNLKVINKNDTKGNSTFSHFPQVSVTKRYKQLLVKLKHCLYNLFHTIILSSQSTYTPMASSSILFIILSVLVLLLHPTIGRSDEPHSTLDAIIKICNKTMYSDVCIAALEDEGLENPPTPTLAVLLLLHSEKLQIERDAEMFYDLYNNVKTPVDVKLELINCKKIYGELVEDYRTAIIEVENMNLGDAKNTGYVALDTFEMCGGDNPFYGNFPWASVNRNHKMLMYDIIDVILAFIDSDLEVKT